MHIVVVGNGVAGIEAALAVRAAEPGWEITVVSEESDHFFSRTALMYVLSGQLSCRDIEPRPRELYAQQRLNRVRARAVGLDRAGHRLRFQDRPPLAYDRLLLACGSRPRPAPWPGGDLPGVGTFVTLQDLAWLEAELHGAPTAASAPPNPLAHVAGSGPDSPYWPRARSARVGPPRDPVVIGGGLIGCEVVETLLAAGLRPRFLIRQAWFWPIALDAGEAGWVAEHLRGHGVDVVLEAEVQALRGAGAVAEVATSAGTFPCDLAVVAIGVTPNTGWLQSSGLQLDPEGGVVVDAALRTSDPDVFAAGDCASVPWRDGRQRPEQLWYTARDQGRVAARALLGQAARYERGIWYNSAKFLDIEYTTVGQVNQDLPGEQGWSHEERGAVRSRTRVVTVDGRIVGFNGLGRRWDHTVIQGWIAAGWTLERVRAALPRASFDTELVPPLRVS